MTRVLEKISLVYKAAEMIAGAFFITACATVCFAVVASIGRMMVCVLFDISDRPVGAEDHVATFLAILAWNATLNFLWWWYYTREGDRRDRILASIASDEEKFDARFLVGFSALSVFFGLMIGILLPLF